MFFFFKQKAAYEMRISDWSSDVCSSDLAGLETARRKRAQLSATDDVAFSQQEHLVEAMDDLQSNRFVLGEHHLALTVFGETPKILAENMSIARAALSESGIVAAREDLAPAAADRKSVVEGTSVAVGDDLGGRLVFNNKKKQTYK